MLFRSGPALDETVVELVRADRLVARGGKLWFAGREPPARRVGLRTGTTAQYRLVDVASERSVGTVDESRLHSVAHPGAVYLHQGRQYRVLEVHEQHHEVAVEEYEADEFTQARSDTDIDITALEMTELRILATLAAGGNPGAESSVLKITTVDIEQRLHELGIDLLGHRALVFTDDVSTTATVEPGVPAGAAAFVGRYLNGRAASIFGGSHEVQRNIIAKSVLGL